MVEYRSDKPPFSRTRSERIYAKALSATIEKRAADPKLDPKFCDVHFRRLITDPIGTARDCYAHFGMELPQEAEDCMRVWLERSDDHVAKRKFTLAEFDLITLDAEPANGRRNHIQLPPNAKLIALRETHCD